MQPQDAGGGFEWSHALSALGGGLVTAIGAAIGWIYKAGGREPTIRAAFTAAIGDAEKRVEDKIDAVKDDLETKIDQAEKRGEEKVEAIVGHFHEAFSGIRQQMNDNALEVEREFLRKEDYKALRNEDRDAFTRFEERFFKQFDDLKANIARIIGDKP